MNRRYIGMLIGVVMFSCNQEVSDSPMPEIKQDADVVRYEVRGYYSNGNLESLQNYNSSGELHGKSIIWHPNGQKRAEFYFQNGLRQGSFTSWYTDGKRKFEGAYLNDQLHGRRVYWLMDGEVYSVEYYENGEIVEEYKGDDAERILQENQNIP